jgi:S1-C subfamily serine protease
MRLRPGAVSGLARKRDAQYASSTIIADFAGRLAAICCAVMLCGCVIQNQAPDSHLEYPVVAAGEDQTFTGTVDNNPAAGTAYVELQASDTDDHCRGEGHLLKRHAFTCAGEPGACRLQCDDGTTIECRYQLLSCDSGYGIGLSADRRWFAFSFGPRMSGMEGREVTARLRTYIASLPHTKSLNKQRHGREISSGTGFFISSDGYIVSAFHVVQDAREINVVLRSGESLRADVKGSDEANDLALLKVRHHASPLPVVSSKDVAVGDQVITIGYPLVEIEGQEQKTTFGRVNALSGAEDDVRFIQMDVPIQPGNSGGPLIDSRGRVVGIVTRTLDPAALLREADAVPQNTNYAVKSDYLLPLMVHYEVEPARARAGAPDRESDIVKHVRDSIVMIVAQ